MSGESMAHKVTSKVNARLKFLHRKNKYLTLNLRRLLCNALIQLHLDYACSAWYPNLSKKLKKQNSNFTKQMHSFLSTVKIKCPICLKKNLKQLMGCPLKKDIISISIQLPSNILIINALII